MSKLSTVNQALTTLGGHVTLRVGTMWMAIFFSALALVSLPAVIASHDLIVIISWITQSFLQLVLLPVIIVGQNLQGAKTEARDQETHDAVMAEHAETQEILAALHAKLDGPIS
jgi:hypothetical protein